MFFISLRWMAGVMVWLTTYLVLTIIGYGKQSYQAFVYYYLHVSWKSPKILSSTWGNESETSRFKVTRTRLEHETVTLFDWSIKLHYTTSRPVCLQIISCLFPWSVFPFYCFKMISLKIVTDLNCTNQFIAAHLVGYKFILLTKKKTFFS